MITLTKFSTKDTLKIWLSIDDLYKDIVSDLINLETWEPLIGHCYFQIRENNLPIGVGIITNPFNNCIGFHGGFYKNFRNKDSRTKLKECLNVLRKDESFIFITTVKESNKLVRNFIKKCGFIEKAIIPNGYANDNLVLYSEV